MHRLSRGLAAGLVATVALSILMVIKSAAGLMPELNAIRMLTSLSQGTIGTGNSMFIGWIIHFLIGTVLWGGLFALLNPAIPTKTQIGKGIVFSLFAWLLMMVIIMPWAGAGYFASNIGVQAAVATLVLHIIFGTVLGWTFKRLTIEPSANPPI